MSHGAAFAGPFAAPARSVHFDLDSRREQILSPGDPVPARSESGFLWVDVELPAPDAVTELAAAGLIPDRLHDEDAAPSAVSGRFGSDEVHLGLVGVRLRGRSLVLDRRHVVITDRVVVSMHRGVPDHFSALRARYRDDFVRFARSHGFLIFEICGQLADDLGAAVRELGDRIDELRLASLRSGGAADAETGTDLLSSVLLIRRILARTRDVLIELSSRRSLVVPETTQPFLRDIAHRLDGQLSDLAFSRDVLSGALAEGPRTISGDPGLAEGAVSARAQQRADIDRLPLRFVGLGGFEVRRGNEPIAYSAFDGDEARCLLAALLCAGGPVQRRDLAGWLWPGLEETRSTRALDGALLALRNALDPWASQPPPGLSEESDTVRLALGRNDSWDVEEFLERARAARDALDVAERISLHEAALSLYRGPLYPEWLYADWSSELRGRCEHAHREVRAGLAEALVSVGRAGEAVQLFEDLLAAEPECEDWHRGLMRAHAEAGNRSLALRQFHTCRSVLRQASGAEPSEETQSLYLELLRRG